LFNFKQDTWGMGSAELRLKSYLARKGEVTHYQEGCPKKDFRCRWVHHAGTDQA